ncbi:MAG TPA: ABC transporter substrate-binding protein [Xanthobacteraceae bacterium]|nr:ABC transporter substrate-binding protein [Xanthobacteraceae bacterium]
MKRRAFISLLGGAAAWPIAAHAQQGERMPRIGVLTSFASDDPAEQTYILAFTQALAQSGWIDGRNARIDIRWGAGDPEHIRRYAAELVALAPGVILAVSSAATGPLLQATRTVPVVFVEVAEPVGAGFVETLARPGGNATGFMLFEYGIGAKWLELLKEVAPGVKRVAFLQTPAVAAGPGQFGAMQALAPSLGVEVRPINVRGAGEIERAITALARPANGGLIVPAAAARQVPRDVIIELAAQHRLPAVYSGRDFITLGGLMSFGPDRVDQYRRAAAYVDRILKGEKPADLPVQAPTKYELVINLKTAKALGLEIPSSVLARADEVIE